MTAAGEFARLSDAEFRKFQEIILAETGICLKGSKVALVESRLGRRLRSLGLSSYGEYLRHLLEQPSGSPERGEMINCITTNKTDFFRENHHFDFLRDRVIPEARARAAAGDRKQLRIWSAACSTGEEPYSIAMTVRDALGLDTAWDVKILASDIDTAVLATGEAGVFAGERLEKVSDALLRRHFLRCQDHSAFQAKDELRGMIRFRQINFIAPRWPIQATFDVIFCRNVVIYFDRPTQQRLFERLAGYLKPTGYLLVGHSENLHWMHDLLEPLQPTIYRVRGPRAPG